MSGWDWLKTYKTNKKKYINIYIYTYLINMCTNLKPSILNLEGVLVSVLTPWQWKMGHKITSISKHIKLIIIVL